MAGTAAGAGAESVGEAGVDDGSDEVTAERGGATGTEGGVAAEGATDEQRPPMKSTRSETWADLDKERQEGCKKV